MTRTCCLVVNPAAGGGRAKRLLPVVTGVLDEAGVRYGVTPSTSLEHAKELALAAVGRGEAVVAFGGDGMAGTLAGVVAGVDGVFGIIPSGRGNDFARTLDIPFEPGEAARVLVTGQERPVDLIAVGRAEAGVASPANAKTAGPGELVVAGSVYLGIPAVAAEIAAQSRMPPGELAYPVAALRAVAGWRNTTFRLELVGEPGTDSGPGGGSGTDGRPGADGGPGAEGRPGADGRPGTDAGFGADGGPGPEGADAGGGADPTVREFSGGAVVVANSRYFGAGMMVAPEADASDGLLDVVYIQGSSKAAMLHALSKIKKGTHVSMRPVGTGRARVVTVTVGRAMPGGADGESLPCARPLDPGVPLRIRVLPGALQVISP